MTRSVTKVSDKAAIYTLSYATAIPNDTKGNMKLTVPASVKAVTELNIDTRDVTPAASPARPRPSG